MEEDQGTPISCQSHRSGFFEFVLFFSFSLRRRISFTAAAGTDHLVGARESAASDDDLLRIRVLPLRIRVVPEDGMVPLRAASKRGADHGGARLLFSLHNLEGDAMCRALLQASLHRLVFATLQMVVRVLAGF